MNIEGVNLLSPLPGNSTIEGGARSLLENGSIPEGFSNALMGQIELLSEANGQVELPGQLQSIAMLQTINNANDIGDLLKHKGNEEELAALFGEYLPISYEKNETVDLDATLLALTEALKSITPGMTPDEVATAQNISDVMALNGLSFVKPLPEEAKLNMPGGEEEVASGDFLQKKTVLRQLIQDKKDLYLQYIENADPAEKTLVIKKQSSISGIEQAAPGVTSDMIPFHRPVDNKTDIPAITRPLTHPGWSKDLGEQIVWMNNKAIPAAEIKLNPAHLGPISVRIDVNQDQATILFTAQHAEVKEAIEASIPKLREMLATQQLNLINVNISQNSTSDQGRSQSQTFSKTPENREQGIEGVTDTIDDRIVVSKGLLSLYA
jgi:hypothetical protein